MAGTAPTDFQLTRTIDAGPVHCSVWLSRGRFAIVTPSPPYPVTPSSSFPALQHFSAAFIFNHGPGYLAREFLQRVQQLVGVGFIEEDLARQKARVFQNRKQVLSPHLDCNLTVLFDDLEAWDLFDRSFEIILGNIDGHPAPARTLVPNDMKEDAHTFPPPRQAG
jgi:hypothetical protein